MVTEAQVRDALRTINDPEMPINIVDLGIVDAIRLTTAGEVEIVILPTFVGCPALPIIEDDIRKRIARLPAVTSVAVRIQFAPPWSVDRISAEGRESLARFGITVPSAAGAQMAEREHPRCPFCGSPDVLLESPFGPTRCKMIYYCQACKHPFEHLKRVSLDLQRVAPGLG